MLCKDLASWTVSILKETNAWFWNGMGGLWSWFLGLWPWFWSLELPGQLVIVTILVGISLYVAWKSTGRIPDRIFIACAWPFLFGGFVPLAGMMIFYGFWIMVGFLGFAGVAFLGFFEIPIRAGASLF